MHRPAFLCELGCLRQTRLISASNEDKVRGTNRSGRQPHTLQQSLHPYLERCSTSGAATPAGVPHPVNILIPIRGTPYQILQVYLWAVSLYLVVTAGVIAQHVDLARCQC